MKMGKKSEDQGKRRGSSVLKMKKRNKKNEDGQEE